MKLKSIWIYRFLKIILYIALRLFFRIRFSGEGTIPRGPKIYVVNHPTVFDLFPILALVKNDFIHVLIEEQIWSFALARFFMKISNQVCLKTGIRFQESMEDSLFLLKNGHSIVMSPEGGRTHPDEKARGRKSVVRMLFEAKVPVLPVGVWLPKRNIIIKDVHYDFQGSQYVDKAHFPRFRTRYGTVFGEPIFFNEFFSRDLTADQYQKIADRILQATYELSDKARKLVQG